METVSKETTQSQQEDVHKNQMILTSRKTSLVKICEVQLPLKSLKKSESFIYYCTYCKLNN